MDYSSTEYTSRHLSGFSSTQRQILTHLEIAHQRVGNLDTALRADGLFPISTSPRAPTSSPLLLHALVARLVVAELDEVLDPDGFLRRVVVGVVHGGYFLGLGEPGVDVLVAADVVRDPVLNHPRVVHGLFDRSGVGGRGLHLGDVHLHSLHRGVVVRHGDLLDQLGRDLGQHLGRPTLGEAWGDLSPSHPPKG